MKQPGLTGIYFGLLANWTPGRQNLPGASREADPLNDTWERAGSLTPKKPQRAEETPGSPSPSQRAPNRGSQARTHTASRENAFVVSYFKSVSAQNRMLMNSLQGVCGNPLTSGTHTILQKNMACYLKL